jgi:hypothetical protein
MEKPDPAHIEPHPPEGPGRALASPPGMAGLSTPRAIKVDDELDVFRLNDESDDDDHGEATKVGPMTKAFVDQLMFKAHLAESTPPSASPHTGTVPPESGERPRDVNLSTSADADAVPRLFEEDPDAPFEATVLSDSVIPPEASRDGSIRPSAPLLAIAPPAPQAAPSHEELSADLLVDASEPALQPPALPTTKASAVEATAAVEATGAVDAPAVEADAPAVEATGAADAPAHPVLPALFVEPSLSARGARWMAASSVYPLPDQPPLDRRVVLQIAAVVAALVVASIIAVVWLFP